MIINGIEYEERHKPTATSARYAPYLMMMMAMYGGLKTKHKGMPDYNLIEEFELIQNKKSKLSRAQREHVIKHFNRTFQIKES